MSVEAPTKQPNRVDDESSFAWSSDSEVKGSVELDEGSLAASRSAEAETDSFEAVVQLELIPDEADTDKSTEKSPIDLFVDRLNQNETLNNTRGSFVVEAMKASRKLRQKAAYSDQYNQSAETYKLALKEHVATELELRKAEEADTEEIEDEEQLKAQLAAQISVYEAANTTKLRHEAFMQTKYGKFLDWYSRQSKWKKIGYGAAGTTLIAAGGAVVAGAAAASGLAAGAATTAATFGRLGRNYAGQRAMRLGSGDKKANDAGDAFTKGYNAERDNAEDEAIKSDRVFGVLMATLRSDVEKEIKQNQKSAGRAAAATALGALIGGTVASLLSESADAAQIDTIDTNEEVATPPNPLNEPDHITDFVAETPSGAVDASDEAVISDEALVITADQELAENAVEVGEFSYHAAQGEGFTHMLKGLAETYNIEGLDPQDYYEVYQQNEAVFAEMEASGLAYRMPNGDWGITSPGELSFDDQRTAGFLRALQEQADAKAGLETPSVDFVAESEAVENITVDAEEATTDETQTGSVSTFEYGGEDNANTEIDASEDEVAETDTTETEDSDTTVETAEDQSPSAETETGTEAVDGDGNSEAIDGPSTSDIERYERMLTDEALASKVHPISMARKLWPSSWESMLDKAIDRLNIDAEIEVNTTGTGDLNLMVVNADGSKDYVSRAALHEIAKSVLAVAKGQ